MNIYEDYINYIGENNDFLDKLYSTNSELLFCFEDVIKVCDTIYKMYDKKETISDEINEIFEIGFGYLVNTINDLKSYYKDCLNSDIIALNHYSRILVYSILLEDYKAYLVSNEEYDGNVKDVVEKGLKEVDDIVTNKKTFDDEVIQSLEKILNFATEEDYKPSYLIFSMIFEELQN